MTVSGVKISLTRWLPVCETDHASRTRICHHKRFVFSVFWYYSRLPQNARLRGNEGKWCNHWRIGGGGGGHGRALPSDPKFLHFHAVFEKNWPNNRLVHPHRVGTPSGKSWMHHWRLFQKTFIICIDFLDGQTDRFWSLNACVQFIYLETISLFTRFVQFTSRKHWKYCHMHD